MKDETRDKTFTTFGIYKEIIPDQKLVFTWEREEPGQAESLVTVTFKDKKGGTEVIVLHERFVDMADEKGHKEGWTSALENLAKQIETGDREIVISRVFDAPRELVWKAWTDPKEVVKWWGPKIFRSPSCKIDFRVGGKYLFCMKSDTGPEIWEKGIWSTGVYKDAENLPVVIERIFNTPIQKVWEAITDKDQMKKWYFDLPAFKPEVGFEFQFSGGTDKKKYLHLCKITEVIPGRKLTYSWRYDEYEGNSFVTFELFPEENKTKLKLTHEGLETFPKSNPDLAKENFMEGWTSIIGTSLKKFLENA